jgi:hypothetical protein
MSRGAPFVVIKLLGLAGIINKDAAKHDEEIRNTYVVSCDVDAMFGRGRTVCTRDVDKAMKFASPADAWTYWTRQSQAQPLRDDGQPNRPMTAYHALIETVYP